jgi:hypothetical protein
MPIAFHLTLSRAAIHTGETNRRALRVQRRRHKRQAALIKKPEILLLPPSPGGDDEMPVTPVEFTARPTLDLTAALSDRPRVQAAPNDVEYGAFGGESPGFCLTGKCVCGRCGGRGRDRDRGSRYTSEDYERDMAEYYAAEPEPEPSPSPIYYRVDFAKVCLAPKEAEPYETAKMRIVGNISEFLRIIGTKTDPSAREEQIFYMTGYLLREPRLQEFLDRNPNFKAVVRKRMDALTLDAKEWETKERCTEVIARYY